MFWVEKDVSSSALLGHSSRALGVIMISTDRTNEFQKLLSRTNETICKTMKRKYFCPISLPDVLDVIYMYYHAVGDTFTVDIMPRA